MANRMGIAQNYLYRVLPGLQEQGHVTRRGRGWHPKGSPATSSGANASSAKSSEAKRSPAKASTTKRGSGKGS
jgi:hypothetical protein